MNRFIEIASARRRLERTGWPRLQMAVIVLTTGATGLLASFLLLSAGLHSMLLRYPLAVLIAYGMFLLAMWAWVRWQGAPDVLDLADFPTVRAGSGGGGWSGSGGSSGGGGASSSWGPSATSGPSSGSGSVDVLDGLDGDGLPLLALVALIAVAVVCLVAAGWVVWTAPALMAELMVDAAIAGGLYKRMRGARPEGWWWLCVRHTFWPLVGVVLFFVVLGALAGHFAPQATTLAQALQLL